MRRHRLPSALLTLLGAFAGTLAIAACGGSSSPNSTTSSSTTTSTHTTSSHHKFHSGSTHGYY